MGWLKKKCHEIRLMYNWKLNRLRLCAIPLLCSLMSSRLATTQISTPNNYRLTLPSLPSLTHVMRTKRHDIFLNFPPCWNDAIRPWAWKWKLFPFSHPPLNTTQTSYMHRRIIQINGASIDKTLAKARQKLFKWIFFERNRQTRRLRKWRD